MLPSAAVCCLLLPSESPLSPSGCGSVQVIVFTMIDAALVGLLFVRLSRGTSKASHIVFSDQAVLRCVQGSLTVAFQLSELNFFTYHPVLQPKLSVYAATRIASIASDAAHDAAAAGATASTGGGAVPAPPAGYGPARGVLPSAAFASPPSAFSSRTYLKLCAMRVTNSASQDDGSLLLTVPQVSPSGSLFFLNPSESFLVRLSPSHSEAF